MDYENIINFRMPRYEELPAIDLYIDQAIQYVEIMFSPLEMDERDRTLTNAMVNNYVKKGVVPPPVKKKYSRVHIVYIIIAYLAKQIFTIDEIARMIEIQKESFDIVTTYNYMCEELENILRCVFSGRTPEEDSSRTRTKDRFFVRSTLVAFAEKIYVKKLLADHRSPLPDR